VSAAFVDSFDGTSREDKGDSLFKLRHINALFLEIGVLTDGSCGVKLGSSSPVGVTSTHLRPLFIYWTNPKFHREDWRAATNEIPANVIFAWPVPFDPYIWYGGKGKGVVRHFPANKDEVSKSMGLLGNLSEVYFFEYLQTLSDPNKEIQTWLTENGYVLIKTLNYNGVGLIYKYTK